MKRKKNPKNLSPDQIYDEILKNKNISDIEYLGSGAEAKSFYFNVNVNTHIFNTLIKKGKYVLKIYKKFNQLTDRYINYLKTLSNYGLIPKIYHIDANTIIMKYIKGKTYDQIRRDLTFREHEYVLEQINKLIRIWENLGFYHGDISDGNILITDDRKVYFIDPYVPTHEDED